jgi:hypothetical protein
MIDNERALTISGDMAAHAHKLFQSTPFQLFGEPFEEQKNQFLELFAHINPRDFLEEEWVRDIFDFSWNVRRLRNWKVTLLNGSAYRGLENVLAPLIGPTDAMALAHDWHVRDEAAVERVEEILASAKVLPDTAMAETFALRSLEIERIDRLIADALAGRAAIFREIERHRSTFAKQLQQRVGQIEDAEYKEVENSSGTKAT